MEFNVIGRGACSLVRAGGEQGTRAGALMHLTTRAQVRKAIHVPTHRFVALKCISVHEKVRSAAQRAWSSKDSLQRGPALLRTSASS